MSPPHVVPFGAPIPNPGWPEPGLPRRTPAYPGLPLRHAGSSAARASHTENSVNVLFQSLGCGFVNCGFHNIAQGSGNLNLFKTARNLRSDLITLLN